MTITVYRDIPYGSGFLQKVDFYIPPGTPKGVILFIHGGGWTGGSKSAYGFSGTLPDNVTPEPAQTINDNSAMTSVCDTYNYVVASMNYRLASDGATYGYGGSNDGYNLAPVNDVKTVLNFLTVSGAGNAWHPTAWLTASALVTQYGLMVTGASAGGHLAVMGVGEWGNSSGIWPKNGVAPIVGPMNNDHITLNDPTVTQPVKDIVNHYVQDGGVNALRAVSPYYQYGTDSSPGAWHNTLKASALKFYFYYNNNDNLVAPVLITPFINRLTSELGSSRVIVNATTQGQIDPNVPSHNLTVGMEVIVPLLASQAFALFTTRAVASANWTIGQSNSVTPVVATGGAGPTVYSITPALPNGISLNSSTGLISGSAASTKPTVTHTITATDAAGKTSSQTFNLTIGSGQITIAITDTEWNDLQTKISSVMAAPSGTTNNLGWNQAASITRNQVGNNSKIYGAEFNTLSTDVDFCYQHISNVRNNFVTRNKDYLVSYTDYVGIAAQVDFCYNNRLTAHPTKLTSVAGLNFNAGVSFAEYFIVTRTLQWANNAAFRAFWNGGGYITFSQSRSGGTSSSQNQAWSNMLANAGSFVMRSDSFTQVDGAWAAVFLNAAAGNAGPYNMAGGNTNGTAQVASLDSGYSGNNMWWTYEVLNASGAPTSDPKQAARLRLEFRLNDVRTAQGGAADIVDGTLVASTTVYYPYSTNPTLSVQAQSSF